MKNRAISALNDARATLASIPIYAQQLCEEKEVRVHFDRAATTACTNGTLILLPALPFPNSDDDLPACEAMADLVQVFIPHEVGHIRYTAFDVMEGMTTELERGLLNCIEDPRMELVMIEALPGTRHQMDRGTERLAQMGWFPVLTADREPADLLTGYVLCYLRGRLREQATLWETAVASRPAVVQAFGERFTRRLEALLDTDGMNLRSTKDAADLTRAILQAFQCEAEQQKAERRNDKGGSEQGAGQSGTATGNQDADPATGSDSGSGAPAMSPKADGAPTQGADSAAGSSDDQNGSQAASGNASQATPAGDGDHAGADGSQEGASGAGGSGASPDAFSRALQVGPTAPTDLGKMLAQALEQANDEVFKRGICRVEGGVCSSKIEGRLAAPGKGRPVNQVEAEQAVRAMKTRLRSLLQGQTISRSYESVRGSRIDSRRAYRTSQSNRRLFLHLDEQKGVETVVYLLGDISGSMSGREEVLSNALYAVAEAMHSTPGVKVGAGVFPAFTQILPIGASPKAHVERMGLGVSGGTPMGAAMYWAARKLARRPEPRKILMVMTDGVPDDPREVRAANAALEAMGVEVFGVGIAEHRVANHFDNVCVVATIADLAPALMEMLHRAMTGPARKAA